MVSVDTHSNNESDRLIHFPISFFAIVMGLSGLTIAWKATGGESIGVPVSFSLGIVTSLVMLVVTGLYLTKIFRFPNAIKEELKHPKL